MNIQRVEIIVQDHKASNRQNKDLNFQILYFLTSMPCWSFPSNVPKPQSHYTNLQWLMDL